MRSAGSTDDKTGDYRSARLLETNDLATQTIDVAALFTKDVAASGSFDIGGSIWATSFGKLLQALPISAMIVDHSYKVAAANEAWGRIFQKHETVLGIHFSELFAAPSIARKMQSVAEKVFNTRRPKVVEAPIRVRKAEAIWGRISLCSIRILQERFLLILVEDLTNEKKRRDHLETAVWELGKKVKKQNAELSQINEGLVEEIKQRRKIEESLKAVTTEVEGQLRELRQDMILKMRVCLQPFIDRLKAEKLPPVAFLLVESMDHHLANTSSLAGVRLAPRLTILTPREIQICNLIVSGLTSKQIASVMNVTVEAITSRKRLIKKKLDLDLSKESMATWLRILYDFQTDQDGRPVT